MSGITGIGSDTISSILDFIYAASDTSASESVSDDASSDTASNTSEASEAADLAASLAVLAAEAQLSQIETLLGGSPSSDETMSQLFMSAENYKVLIQSDILDMHPELASTLLDDGTSSSSTADIEDYLSGIASSGSIIDYFA